MNKVSKRKDSSTEVSTIVNAQRVARQEIISALHVQTRETTRLCQGHGVRIDKESELPNSTHTLCAPDKWSADA